MYTLTCRLALRASPYSVGLPLSVGLLLDTPLKHTGNVTLREETGVDRQLLLWLCSIGIYLVLNLIDHVIKISGIAVCFKDVVVLLYIIHTYRVMVIIKTIIMIIIVTGYWYEVKNTKNFIKTCKYTY